MAYDNTKCSDQIVKAHIISKKYLNNIALDGHVYVPEIDLKNGSLGFKRKGVEITGVMSCFCKFHDEHLFQSFEKEEFSGTYRQVYDVTFRALCREYFQKKHQLLELLKGESNHFKLNRVDESEMRLSDHLKYMRQQLDCQLRDHEFLYNQLRKYRDSGLQYVLIKTTKLPLSSTGIIFPSLYPNGTRAQKQRGKQLGFVYSVINLEECSYIIISTVKTLYNNFHRDYLEQMLKLSNRNLVDFLLRYFFFNNDSFAINPDWYDGLPQDFRGELKNLMNIQNAHYGDTFVSYSQLGFSGTFSGFKVFSVKHSIS
jgi:hypothetical protein